MENYSVYFLVFLFAVCNCQGQANQNAHLVGPLPMKQPIHDSNSAAINSRSNTTKNDNNASAPAALISNLPESHTSTSVPVLVTKDNVVNNATKISSNSEKALDKVESTSKINATASNLIVALSNAQNMDSQITTAKPQLSTGKSDDQAIPPPIMLASSNAGSPPGPPAIAVISTTTSALKMVTSTTAPSQGQPIQTKKPPSGINTNTDDDGDYPKSQANQVEHPKPSDVGLEDANEGEPADDNLIGMNDENKKEGAVKDNDVKHNPVSTSKKENNVPKAQDSSQPRMPYGDEPDNSHFLAYLLIIGGLIIAAYFLAHNRHKLMGLILEGRQSRRYRAGSVGSRGVKYKRLQLDDADGDNVHLSSRDGGRVIY